MTLIDIIERKVQRRLRRHGRHPRLWIALIRLRRQGMAIEALVIGNRSSARKVVLMDRTRDGWLWSVGEN